MFNVNMIVSSMFGTSVNRVSKGRITDSISISIATSSSDSVNTC